MALETSADAPAPLRRVSRLLAGYIGRLGVVWVEAEVAQIRRRPGICFLVLRDLAATMSVRATCHSSVLDAGPAPVTEGARVVVQAKCEFYEPSGDLQLTLREIRPQGEGALLARLEQRKQLLAAEGLFDPRLKKRLPTLPTTVGLVTAANSAAERDVLATARARWPGVDMVVRHALMQGSGSALEVAAALRELDGQVDVVVVARGGGSLEDLLPFSDEALIRAVHAARVPVVSAIGHEIDAPLLDLVADVRASTPTDAAKRVVPDVGEQSEALAELRHRARRAVQGRLEQERHRLDALGSRPVLARPVTLIETEQQRVDDAVIRARRSLRHRLDRDGDALQAQLARLRGLSPLATLQRGYAIARAPDGRVLRTVADVPERFAVRLADGTAHVTTRSTEEDTDDREA